MNHRFTGPAFTIGIEEELMIFDSGSPKLVSALEASLAPTPAGEIKPELMESVLEVSTDPCRNTAEAGEQLRALRRQVTEAAAARKPAIGSAGTHPFACGRTSGSSLAHVTATVSRLRVVAHQELMFGMHVHVGIDDPDEAIHVANGSPEVGTRLDALAGQAGARPDA